MSVLGQGAGSDYPTSIDSAEQQTDGASGTLADANWANDVTSAIVAIQTELGADPAGSAANLVTRLAKALAATGGLNSGTTANRPASPIMGQPYYNTSTDKLEVYDSDLASWNSIAGVTDHGGLTGLTDDDHTQYIKADGTRNSTGPVNLNYSTPVVQLAGTEGSGDKFGIKEDAGLLYISRNTGTVASPSWTDLVSITTAGVVKAITDDVVGRDTGNSVDVSLKTHASRHRLGGYDALDTLQYYAAPMHNFVAGDYIDQRLFLVSGTKTFNWRFTISGPGLITASILNETTASATAAGSGAGVRAILNGSFLCTSVGESTFRLSADPNGAATLLYAFSVWST